MSENDVAMLFLALSNPTRIRILKMLEEKDRYFLEIVEILGGLHSAVHFHLQKLSDCGLVSQERNRGKYVITEGGREALKLIKGFRNGVMPNFKEKVEGSVHV